MSEYLLTIGKIEDAQRMQACRSYLASLGVVKKSFFGRIKGVNMAWAHAPAHIVDLCLLNLATVTVFLEYVARLEGHDIETASQGTTHFPHLPWYMDSIWLPVSFDAPTTLSFEGEMPVFLGSCSRLQEELKEIQRRADCSLGDVPDGYSLMRSDRQAFYQSSRSIEDEHMMLQWVWRGLYDGVKIALEHSAPLLGNGY